jgi:molybdenum cofactor synthesis domain-containing protein
MQDSTALLSFEVERLLAPEQALIAFFSASSVARPGVEYVALASAAGRILAENAVAREDHPSHARSTMDGFALASAGPSRRRRISGDVLMGHAAPHALGADEAMRIPTGGALPLGADAVVPQEDVTVEHGEIVLANGVATGDFVTQRAEDIASGETVLEAGRRIGGPELGVLATLGLASVPVFRRPRVAIVSTGDELVDPGSPLEVGMIRDSNRYAIAGALIAFGAEPVHLPRAIDTPEALRAQLVRGLGECDAVVTTGGSSVGARDLVPRIVAELGAPGPIVHGVRVKPGKPTLLAAVGAKPVIGLPGNPASALTILEAIARPIFAMLTGETGARPTVLDAVAAAPFVGRGGWTWYVPARLRTENGRLLAEPLVLRSAQTSLLARSAGYATLGETSSRIAAGDVVRIALFSAGGAPIEAS